MVGHGPVRRLMIVNFDITASTCICLLSSAEPRRLIGSKKKAHAGA